jgi:CelD/BcsL family acetyltransferase involved in cellulose biosynthesis
VTTRYGPDRVVAGAPASAASVELEPPAVESPQPVAAAPWVEVVRTQEALNQLAADWDLVLESSRTNNVFLTWSWISTWWHVYGGRQRLHVIVVRAGDGTIIGIAPLKRTRLGPFGGDIVSFIGTGSDVTPEYLDFIVVEGLEPLVLGMIVRELLEDAAIAAIDLYPVADDSANVAYVTEALVEQPGVLKRRQGAVCPFLALPPTVEEFRLNRSRNYRKKLGEYERRCDRGLSARLRRASTHAEVTHDLATLKGLHRKRWNGRSRAFRSTQYLEFHRRFARLALDRGWLRLYSLETAATTMAVVYCFLYQSRYYFYQSGRDPRFTHQRAGLVLMHKVIQESIRDGAAVFDFLSGDEAYKGRWATGRRFGYRVSYWKSTSAWAVSMCHHGLATMAKMPGRLLPSGTE